MSAVGESWEWVMSMVVQASVNAADKAYKHLTKHNYSPKDVEWVRHAMVHEAHVPVTRIDISHTPNDPQKIERMVKQLKAGDKLPKVLLADVGYGKLRIADGHHRVYASRKAGLTTVRAYVLTHVKDDPKAPWRVLHDQELQNR